MQFSIRTTFPITDFSDNNKTLYIGSAPNLFFAFCCKSSRYLCHPNRYGYALLWSEIKRFTMV